MTSALNYMHSQNFLHRDIKLENTVLQSGGKVFIVGEYVRSGFGAMTRILKYVSVEILKYTVKQFYEPLLSENILKNIIFKKV